MKLLSCLNIAWLVACFIEDSSATVLSTSDRWIVNSSSQRVKLRCANWAGHMEAMIPEGLQHQPVSTIASMVKQYGFNCVRLTYSVDMALSPDTAISTAFKNAGSTSGAGATAMNNVYISVVSKNPWAASSTTLGAFTQVIDALNNVGVYVILDNQVSKASWCCSTSDGNGWWASASGYSASNSKYFDVNNWLSSLRAMATYAASHSNVVGMSLRNELRASGSQDGNNHADWYTYVTQGMTAIHSTNSNLLIMVGGVSYALDLTFLYNKPLDRTPYGNKVVWEFHSYSWSYSDTAQCSAYKTTLGDNSGYLIASGKAYTGPLWLSEFGFQQIGTSSGESSYLTCLVGWAESNDIDWAIWALQGDYYVRDGKTNSAESYGLLNSQWTGLAASNSLSRLGAMFQQTQGP